MRLAQSAAVLACLALAACASARKPDVRLPAAFEAANPGGMAPQALDRWWTAFGDPQLEGLIDQALVSAPDAKTAAARLREARATRASNLSSFLPQGNATGSGRRTKTEQLSGTVVNIPGVSTRGTSEAYSADFDVSWEVDLFGRFFAARRAANADLAAARFNAEGARASLAANIADSYFEARGLAIQLADAQESARIQRSLYDLATRRAQLGLAASSDTDRIAGDLAQSDAQAAALEAQLQAARRTLLVLVGRGIDPIASLPTPANVGTAPPVPAIVPGELLLRRPDVREAQARMTAAAGVLTYDKLAFFPTLKFTPGLGWSKVDQPNYSSTSQSWTLGGAITQPILDIPRLMAELKAQDARTEQAVIAYEKTVQTAFGESENALVQLAADRRRVALLQDGEARAARAYEASRVAYAQGLNDLSTTLSAEQSWRATRAQYTAAQVQALRRTVQTYKALGGGWPADFASTNGQGR